MVTYARRTAAGLGLDSVEVRRMRAEDLPAKVAPLRMAAFGASFHWTDRRRVSEAIFDLLEPGGMLAILSASTIQSGDTPWEAATREVVKRHLGAERRAGSGTFRQGERHEQALGRTRFEKIEVIDVPVRELWTLDQIVGWHYSTSFASKSVLGERSEAFEADLRETLLHLHADGKFEKLVEYTAILASR